MKYDNDSRLMTRQPFFIKSKNGYGHSKSTVSYENITLSRIIMSWP